MSKMIKAAAALGVVAGLGVAALPLSSYAAMQNLKVSAEVLSAITIGVQNTDGSELTDNTLNIGRVTPGSDPASGSFNLIIGTNSDKGFEVTVENAASETAMVNIEDAEKKIPAGSVVRGKTGWGIKGGDWYSFTAVPANGNAAAFFTYDEAGVPDNNKVTEKVTVGVSVAEDSGLTQGTYQSTIVFTAVSK